VITAVLFDVGGVLLFPDGDLLAEELRLLIGQEFAADRVVRAWVEAVAYIDHCPAETNSHLERWLLGAGVAPALLSEAAAACQRLLRDPARLWTHVASDAGAALAALHAQGVRLACVSNAEGSVAAELDRSGLGQWFEVVIDSAIVGVEKPDPRIFAVALDQLGLSPADCLYVGDMVSVDMAGARSAGLGAYHLDQLGLHSCATDDFGRIRSLTELVDRVSAARGAGNP